MIERARRARVVCTLATAVVLVLFARADGPVRGQPADASAYRLVATWADRPWQLRAGAFARVVDVALAPDGSLWALDAYQSAMHHLRPDGTPLGVWPSVCHGVEVLEGWVPVRLAVRRTTGELAVLCVREASDGQRYSLVVAFGPDGTIGRRFEAIGQYRDVGLLPDGRIVLVRTWPRVPPTPSRGSAPRQPGGLDVFAADGVRRDVHEPPEIFLPIALDVAPDGDVHVVNWLPLPAGAAPGPEPTPRPSARRARSAAAGEAVEGVVAFDPAFRWRSTIPFDGADDVAVGRQVYVSRQADVFRLGDAEPMWTGPAGALSLPYFGREIALAAGEDGTLAAALGHCWFQGIVDLSKVPSGAAPTFHGQLDRPALAGPLAPIRLAADTQLDVLQGRFDAQSGPGRAPVWFSRVGAEPQSVVRLDPRGVPSAQVGVCGDDQVWFEARSDARWAIDVASGGDWAFEGGPDLVTASRVGGVDPLPAWQLWLGALDPADESDPALASTPHLAALDAHAGRLAILDVGRSHVVTVDLARAAAVEDVASAASAWPLAPLLNDVPVDLAVDADRVFLADAGARRVVVADAGGRPLADFATHDTPQAIAVSHTPVAAAGVFVLGRHGWAMRYSADGRLIARWRLPLPGAATDIAVLRDGRVAVSFLRDGPRQPGDPEEGRRIVQGGVWVFAPADDVSAVTSPPGACLIATDKRASPAVVRRGDAVTVTLTAGGTCPTTRSDVDVVLVVDTSRSMSWDGAIERAQSALLRLLSELDGRRVRAAVVTFADEGKVGIPMTADLARVAGAVAALSAGGDTRLAGALAAADQVVRDSNAGRVAVLLVTDGELKDYPQAAARSMADRGVSLFALAVPLRSYTFQHTRALAGLVGEGNVFVDPDAARTALLAAAITAERAAPRLMQAAVVSDTLPADMVYVDGSADPPARWDGAERRLTWQLPNVHLSDTLKLRYRVVATLVGDRPTNVGARLTGRDGTGWLQAVDFPIPSVKVWDRASLVERAYLPLGVTHACLRPPPGDVVLVLDASRSMDEPALPAAGTKLDVAKAAVASFARRLAADGGRAGLVAFADEATVRVGLTADAAAIERGAAGIQTAPGTRIDRGLEAADRLLAGAGRRAAYRAVVLLTDGRASASPADVIRAADALAAGGNEIHAIALGDDADLTLLGQIVRPASGLVRAADGAAVEGAFDAVFEGVRCRR